MILHIARRQLLDYISSPRFLLAALLCVLIGVGVTWVRCLAYEQALEEYRLIRQDNASEAAGYTQPGPLTYAGVAVTRAPNAMSIFYAGLEPDRPVSFRVAANRDPAAESQYERSNPVRSFFVAMYFTAFVTLIVSILAIALGYDTISGEKEAGTLKLMLSFPVPRSSVVLGKALGGLCALGVPLLLTALGSLLVGVLSPGIGLRASGVLSFCLLAVTALLFLAALYSLAICVSSLTSRAFTTVTALIAIWVLLAVGIPGISPHLARALVEVPSSHEVENDKWSITDDENRARFLEIVEYQKNPHGSSVDQMAFYSELFRKSFLSIATRQEQIHASFERRLYRQIESAGWVSRASPLASFVYVAGTLADTGIDDRYRFRRALQSYRIRFLNYAEDKWMQREVDGTGSITTRDYPRFVFLRPGIVDRFQASLLDLGLLAAWALIFLAVTLVAFLRYDPR